MADYIVELKDSVFRETPLTEGDFDDERRLAFDSKADAEEWVTEQNREHTSRGNSRSTPPIRLTRRTSTPTSSSSR